MSLRLKLLLLGLATLVLPWAGSRYAREMESALRAGESASLLAVADTVAASLQGRVDLMYRAPVDTADPQAAPRPGPYDLEPLVLNAAPLVDGYADDWPQVPAAWAWFRKDDEHRFGVLTGVYDRVLYVMLDVRDPHVVFDAPGASSLDPAAMGDRVWFGFQNREGAEQQVFFAASGPGALTARRVESGEYGEELAVIEPRIRGAWQLTPTGYHLEARVPLSMLGGGFGVLIDNRDQRGAAPSSYGMLRPDDLHTQGRLIVAAPELTTYLEQFAQPGLKLVVTTPAGQILARVDALAQVADLDSEPPPLLARLYRRLVDRPGVRPPPLESQAPIYDRERHDVIGTLQVTQTADRWVRLRDHALTRMLNLTLATSLIAIVGMFAFAAWLALRLSRLRQASESALTRSGIVTSFPGTRARDELGDVARSFSTLLSRLNEYTGYLRTLAGKLAHEIRTPLTIVRSSLENLETEPLPPGARTYLERARQGSERLNAILLAMGAATRVEEAITGAERTRCDLVPLVASAVAAYRSAFTQRRFSAELPAEPAPLDGAPDLIVQMLDKLVDNAVDFSPPGALITVRVRIEPDMAVIEVDNPGATLPPQLAGRLFESLWQSRPEGGQAHPEADSRPHFGLGLYIVRLIAGFHGGEAHAENLPDGSGVRFVVSLARRRDQA